MRKAFVFLSVVMLTVIVGALSAFAGGGEWRQSEWQVADGQGSGWLLAEVGEYSEQVERCKEGCVDFETVCKSTGKFDGKDVATYNICGDGRGGLKSDCTTSKCAIAKAECRGQCSKLYCPAPN